MGIGLSGMISGLDTDSIVKAMVSAQRTKSTKIENKITLNKWTTEAWSGLNTKIYSFYTKYASKLRLQSSYMTRTAKSSNEDVVTATAGSNAAIGTHSLQVNKLASSQYVTGAQLTMKNEAGATIKTNYSKNTKLTAIGGTATTDKGGNSVMAGGMVAGTTISISGKKDVEFTVTDNSTINDFLEACKEAGLNANFDTSQQRFFISSAESGAENAFSITTSKVSGVDELTWRVDTASLDSTQKKEYDEALSTIVETVKANKNTTPDIIATVLDEATYDAKNAEQKALKDAIDKLKEITIDSRAEKEARTIAGENASAEKVEEIKKLILDDTAEIKDTAIESAVENSRKTMDTLDSNLDGYLKQLTAGEAGTGLEKLGLGNIQKDAVTIADGADGMSVVAASDAEFVLDGATMTESSNSFTVNGITLNLVNTTKNEDTGKHKSIQITVGKDADSTYKLVKEALTEYNKLIEEMNKLYDADSARGYDPLTDEQKEAMTEDDIKNWEDKIKSSLLRRDDTLGSLLSGMRSALASTYKDEETGKTFSLSSFGIVTGNYTENGKLHIYGDEDDATYATYTDRLKAALEEDPDQVMETLTSVFGKLYDTMTEKCAKTEISSALTFYNDKQYKNLLDDYEDDLDILEDRIADLEDKYYKQFTAMETALSKLQSQTNSLASLLGSTGQ